jgi:hypothetical protein
VCGKYSREDSALRGVDLEYDKDNKLRGIGVVDERYYIKKLHFGSSRSEVVNTFGAGDNVYVKYKYYVKDGDGFTAPQYVWRDALRYQGIIFVFDGSAHIKEIYVGNEEYIDEKAVKPGTPEVSGGNK